MGYPLAPVSVLTEMECVETCETDRNIFRICVGMHVLTGVLTLDVHSRGRVQALVECVRAGGGPLSNARRV